MTDLAVRSEPMPGNNAPATPPEPITPLDHWLADQRDLTAVDRFSQHHDARHQDVWSDLIPLTQPRPGEQYRFEVDMDACTGCKACVAACHSLNGLDEGESFRSVGTLYGYDASSNLALVQTVTTACHHCVEPACMIGCPTNAYEKDPVTGIVKHLDDQCIGCSYCTLTCPYEVPRYNERLGIVRKCDLCQDRLAEGEAPACVQGCPTNAISVGIVRVDDMIDLTADDHPSHDSWGDPAVVPTAPPSWLTVPTTAYRRREAFPSELDGGRIEAADRNAAHPAHAHTPLAVMLVLTQLAVGLAVGASLLPLNEVGLADPSAIGSLRTVLAIASLFSGALAIGASLLHLGRPTKAWKAVLGLRTSWLSREILAFGVFAGTSALWAGAALLGLDGAAEVLGVVTAGIGIVGVVCSALIYAVTGRRWWRGWRTIPKFLGTATILGTTAIIPIVGLAAARLPAASDRYLALSGLGRPVTTVALAALAAKLGSEVWFLLHPHSSGQLARTARLLRHDLAAQWRTRLAGGLIALALLGCLMGSTTNDTGNPWPVVIFGVLALIAAGIGELAERWLFFTASSPRRMPGSIR